MNWFNADQLWPCCVHVEIFIWMSYRAIVILSMIAGRWSIENKDNMLNLIGLGTNTAHYGWLNSS